MSKKLHISLIFSNLVVFKTLSPNHRMYNLYTKFVKILEICKQFSENLVNESGNVPRRGPVPKFSDLEVVALSLTAETESIDSEKWLFDYKLQEYKDNIPNLISRRQFNDRRKKTVIKNDLRSYSLFSRQPLDLRRLRGIYAKRLFAINMLARVYCLF